MDVYNCTQNWVFFSSAGVDAAEKHLFEQALETKAFCLLNKLWRRLHWN